MTTIALRPARDEDVPALARLRAATWGTEEYWCERISAYHRGERRPTDALEEGVLVVAEDQREIVGFIAGHRSTRFGCEGELEWIDVEATRRSTGVGGRLLAALAEWFASRGVRRVCVDVAPANARARAF